MAIFNGTDGNDTLVGSAGSVDDALNGGLGNDIYRYSLGSGNDVISDTGGADTIELADPLHLFSGWNFYRSGNDLVIDFNGQGRLTVTNQFLGAPIIETLAFADGSALYSFSFSNLLTGTAGNDVLIGTSSGEVINGGGGDDLIFGNEGDDTLFGGEGDDELSGGPGIDALYGDAGNDELHVLKGDSVVDGGAGQDEATFYQEAAGVAVNFSGTTQDVLGHPLADGNVLHADGVTETTLTSIEDGVVGSDYGDVFFAGRTTGFIGFRGGQRQ
jgi:Ca2+-binding RTX toxin-like protein